SLKLIQSCKRERTLALTFGGGPRSWTQTILDELRNNSIKATFFVNGHSDPDFCIYDYAEIILQMYNDGHQIAHHTWSHPHLGQVSPDEIKYQIDWLDVAFLKILGVTPRFIRLPFGEAMNYPELREDLIRRGFKFFALWDVDTNDYLGNVTNSEILFLNGINDTNPHIILSNDTLKITADELVPFYIEQAKNLNYSFDTVAGCNGIHNKNYWYKFIRELQQRDKTWVCTRDDIHG
ncbi:Carbohydrate Esterase Family 4 protein, partial [Gigaspora rosea]